MKPGFLQACAKGAGWETLRCLTGGCAHIAVVLVAGITGSLTSALVRKREGNSLASLEAILLCQRLPVGSGVVGSDEQSPSLGSLEEGNLTTEFSRGFS